MQTKILQKILFPTDEKLQSHWRLFYRGPRCVEDEKHKELYFSDGSTVDFATYLNGFSLQKWRLYTNVKKITLKLRMKGAFILNAVGYHLNPTMPDRHEFNSKRYDNY